jgi:hypothetical protein
MPMGTHCAGALPVEKIGATTMPKTRQKAAVAITKISDVVRRLDVVIILPPIFGLMPRLSTIS